MMLLLKLVQESVLALAALELSLVENFAFIFTKARFAILSALLFTELAEQPFTVQAFQRLENDIITSHTNEVTVNRLLGQMHFTH